MNYYKANNEDNINVKNNKGLDQVPDSPKADLKRLGKILGGLNCCFWRQKFFAKKRQIEGFQKGVNDEKLLGSACVSGG
ncbi:hypothetical protein TNCV_1278761 [Trichonephila clavipes]|nr:hypothetical protein TNCV_1278761 [Trichonephila clavipes]